MAHRFLTYAASPAGATEYFEKIGADTIQSVCNHYAQKRQSRQETETEVTP